MRVAPKTGQTREYTIYTWQKHETTEQKFLIELDGEGVGMAATVKAAHTFTRDHARDHRHTHAGLTEAFGRNRQFILGPRGGWTRYKGEA